MKIIRNEWEVKPIEIDVAREFVEEHHYAHGAANTAVDTFGLFYKGDPNTLHGISWWMPPAYGAAAAAHDDFKNVLTLSRFCLVDDRPENSGSFLIAGSIKKLPKRYHTLVTYADTALEHDGGLYRASNWGYQGLTKKSPRYWDPVNERLVSCKKGPNTYNKQQMKDMGYEFKGRHAMHKYLYPRFERSGLKINARVDDELFFTKDGKISNQYKLL